MFAVIDRGQIVGPSLYETREHAEEQRIALRLPGEVKPVTFDKDHGDPAVVRLKVQWKLEKFEGDMQSPETLLETREGEF